MSFLLYCITRAGHPDPRDELRLLGYPRASVKVRACGLGAVLSEASRADLAPDVPRLLAYAAVIESFNRTRSVIPMRFGSRFSNLAEVESLLRRECGQYGELLRQIDGRIEMSVQVTMRAEPAAAIEDQGCNGAPAGISYLQTRRRHYAQRTLEQGWIDREAAAICETLHGHYVRHTRALPQSRDRNSFSLHFLVPRDGVAAFQRALPARIGSDGPLLAISGPWPAYNFVCLTR